MFGGLIERLSRPMSRPMLFAGMPALYLALTLFFIFLGFPYERVGEGLAQRVHQASGIRVDFEELGPHIGLFGPGLEAIAVTAIPKQGGMVPLDSLVLRPAWSLSWFKGEPAVHADARSPAGRVAGAIQWMGSRGFDGKIDGLDLSAPLVRDLLPFDGLEGTLDADIDLVIAAEESEPQGTVHLSISEGTMTLGGSPLAVPFEVTGDLLMGGESFIEVQALQLGGPMLSGTLTGRILAARGGLENSTLQLEGDVKAEQPIVVTALRSTGARVDREGVAKLQIGGTLGNPRLR